MILANTGLKKPVLSLSKGLRWAESKVAQHRLFTAVLWQWQITYLAFPFVV
jgi:hypothetical protein